MAFVRFIKTLLEPKAERIAEKKKQSGFALQGAISGTRF